MAPLSPPLTIRELSTEELPTILPLIEQHNPKLHPDELRRRLDAMTPHGYRCIAAFHDDRMVGVAGYWLGVKFWCGEYLEPDNVFVLPELRSAGIGAKLMDYLEQKARELGCKVVVLDSYVTFAGGAQVLLPARIRDRWLSFHEESVRIVIVKKPGWRHVVFA